MKPYTLKNKIISKLKFFKLDFQDIELVDNRKLPNWLNFDLKNNFLRLYGKPQLEDVG